MPDTIATNDQFQLIRRGLSASRGRYGISATEVYWVVTQAVGNPYAAMRIIRQAFPLQDTLHHDTEWLDGEELRVSDHRFIRTVTKQKYEVAVQYRMDRRGFTGLPSLSRWRGASSPDPTFMLPVYLDLNRNGQGDPVYMEYPRHWPRMQWTRYEYHLLSESAEDAVSNAVDLYSNALFDLGGGKYYILRGASTSASGDGYMNVVYLFMTRGRVPNFFASLEGFDNMSVNIPALDVLEEYGDVQPEPGMVIPVRTVESLYGTPNIPAGTLPGNW